MDNAPEIKFKVKVYDYPEGQKPQRVKKEISNALKGVASAKKIAKLNKSCCSIEDVEDARMVCSQIGAKHYFLNFVKEFEQNVIDYFVSEYELGRTPHPCLACNDRMKFDFLVERSKIMDADFVATGHYARIAKQQNTYLLQKGITEKKDQSYVLYNLKQQQLKSLMFPIGNYSKDE